MLTKQEIRQLGSKEMMEELKNSRRELLRSQFDIRNGSSKEVHMVKNLRRYIARLQTITKELNLEMKTTGMSKASAPMTEEKAPAAEKAKTAKKAAPKKTTAKSKTSAKSAKK